MQQSLNTSLFISRRNRFICRTEIPKSFAPLPTLSRPLSSTELHASDVTLSDSPLTPNRSSDLLLWAEDPTWQGDSIAEQFWGDIFADLPHGIYRVLTSRKTVLAVYRPLGV